MLKVNKMRSSIALVASFLILSLLAINAVIPNTYGASADMPTARPVSKSTVSTNHMMVQLTFPYLAYPGQSITIYATTTAKSNGRIIRFSIDLFYLNDNQLVKLVSQTIVKDTTVRSGDDWQTRLIVSIPTNALGGRLIGTATEVWQVWWQPTVYPDYYSPYYGTPYYYTSYCPYYQDRGYYAQNYPFYNTYTRKTQTESYLNEFAVRMSPDRQRYVYQRAYMCEPALYYGSRDVTDYPPQVTSKQTFLLTYLVGCYSLSTVP